MNPKLLTITTILWLLLNSTTSWAQFSTKDFKQLSQLTLAWECHSSNETFSQETWQEEDDVSLSGETY